MFKTKRCADGTMEIYKARLVAKRFTLKEGIDLEKTWTKGSKGEKLNGGEPQARRARLPTP